jgi:hypothetical protein
MKGKTMKNQTYNDYLLGILRAKLEGTFLADEAPMAEWEWERLHGPSARGVQITLVAILTDGSSVTIYNVSVDSWTMERGFLSVEANEGDEIHYIPNVRQFYTVCN